MAGPAVKGGLPGNITELVAGVQSVKRGVEFGRQGAAREEGDAVEIVAVDNLGEGGLEHPFLELFFADLQVTGPNPVGALPALGDGEGLVRTDLDMNDGTVMRRLPELAIDHFAVLGDDVTFGLVGGDEDTFGGAQAFGLDGCFLV